MEAVLTKKSTGALAKSEQRAIEASKAWNEHLAEQAHIAAKTVRLRAERLAREARAAKARKQA
jgi:hypothetical protein